MAQVRLEKASRSYDLHYPNVLDKLRSIQKVGGQPFEFYLKLGYHIVGAIPDANGFGKSDILMAKRLRR